MKETPEKGANVLSPEDNLCIDRGGEILQQQIDHVQELRVFFQQKGEKTIVEELSRAEFYLNQPFMIVIVGEFNSGKSAIINAILGDEILEMDVTPTTDVITIISSKDAEPFEEAERDVSGIKQIKLDLPRLENLAIVDTPGTNSLIDRHQQLTEKFVPRADLIIFISSCQQPLTASERYFLSLINQEWKRKIIFVLNKKDLLDEDEMAKVLMYTQTNLKELLGRKVRILPVSARTALKAIKSGDKSRYEMSNLSLLEEIIFHKLGNCEKWQLKLRTPMMAIRKQLEAYETRREQLEESLNREIEAIRKLEVQAAEWSKRIIELSLAYIPAVETPFFRFEESCNRFLDQKMNVIHFIRMKVSGISIEDEFHREVFDDPRFKDDFDKTIGSAIRFVMTEIQRFQHDTLMEIDDQLEKNVSANRQQQSMPDYKRLALQSQIRELDSFDPVDLQTEKESQMIRQSITQAITNFVGLEALGGGVVAVTLASAALYDVTGILLGAVLAGLGFAILPRKRARLKSEFSIRIREIAGKVQESLRHHLHQKIDMSYNELRTALTPYISLCKSELADVQQLKEKLDLFRDTNKVLHKKIDSLTETK